MASCTEPVEEVELGLDPQVAALALAAHLAEQEALRQRGLIVRRSRGARARARGRRRACGSRTAGGRRGAPARDPVARARVTTPPTVREDLGRRPAPRLRVPSRRVRLPRLRARAGTRRRPGRRASVTSWTRAQLAAVARTSPPRGRRRRRRTRPASREGRPRAHGSATQHFVLLRAALDRPRPGRSGARLAEVRVSRPGARRDSPGRLAPSAASTRGDASRARARPPPRRESAGRPQRPAQLGHEPQRRQGRRRAHARPARPLEARGRRAPPHRTSQADGSSGERGTARLN